MKTLTQLMNLGGKRALVTGAAGHVGACLSETLAEMGASIAVVDLEAERCDAVARDIAVRYGVESIPIAVDLADEEALRGCVSKLSKTWGGLDIIVHSAAYVGTTAIPGWAEPFPRQSVEAWNQALQVNLTAAFVLCQAAESELRKSAGGSVIFIGSIYGVVGPDWRLYSGTTLSNPAGYAASKGGLLQLTRYISTVLAPEVRVNMISPGGIWRNQPAVFVDRYTSRTPLKRMATEADLRGAVAYLASDLSSYVTGTNLLVDGGWTAS